jgi:hypothetical protein
MIRRVLPSDFRKNHVKIKEYITQENKKIGGVPLPSTA